MKFTHVFTECKRPYTTMHAKPHTNTNISQFTYCVPYSNRQNANIHRKLITSHSHSNSASMSYTHGQLNQHKQRPTISFDFGPSVQPVLFERGCNSGYWKLYSEKWSHIISLVKVNPKDSSSIFIPNSVQHSQIIKPIEKKPQFRAKRSYSVRYTHKLKIKNQIIHPKRKKIFTNEVIKTKLVVSSNKRIMVCGVTQTDMIEKPRVQLHKINIHINTKLSSL